MDVQTQRVSILGSTGSIGKSTLAVIDANPDRYEIFALSANTDVDGILLQVQKYRPRYVAMADQRSAEELVRSLKSEGISSDTEVLSGSDSLASIASHAEVDTVVAAIVGAAGLFSTMAAVKSGKKILLANKETLVCSGQLFMDSVKSSGATLLPIDSEHNAIFQCLPMTEDAPLAHVAKVYLTGSGGPFRGRSLESLADITPDQACAHPNWSMGRKISVDSATMMNKGLELIEACHLFNISPDLIDIVIHPQSIVHSMVEYVDGSVLAQLGSPDMKTPIASALAWPERISSGSSPFDILANNLTFEPPEYSNYPCLQLAIDVAKMDGTAAVALNASNEIAVAAFLEKKVQYLDIPRIVEKMLVNTKIAEPQTIEAVIELDESVRCQTAELIQEMAY